MDKHFTATTYLLDKNRPRTLLHFHPKLKSWLPPGGHIEKNETPKEAAKREIIEETKIYKFKFIINGESPKRIDNRAEMLMMPHFLLSEKIEEGHFHLDWIYYAWIEDIDLKDTPNNVKFRWFTNEDLNKEAKIFENVRELALKGLDLFYS